MEYSPPPLFKQGASARFKVTIFALISIALLLADAHLRSLTTIRQVIGTTLYPLQMVALAPRDAFVRMGEYFSSLSSMQRNIKALKDQQIANAQILQQSQHFVAENVHLRTLLGARAQIPVKTIMGEILYDTRDVFTRKIVLDRGIQQGVTLGQPVIDQVGVVGQVTRVFLFTAEVTLLTDKDQAIPVQVVRNGLRSIAYGRGQSGLLELHFMAANADIKPGDVLVTSGIDGVYPAGLSVAKVMQVENNAAGAFGRITCLPLAGIGRNKQLLILQSSAPIAPRPPVEEVIGKSHHKHKQEAAKDSAAAAGKEAAKPAVKVQSKAAPKAPPKSAAQTAPKEPTKGNKQ
jgi:rod shape-determining protein MreC